MKLRSIQCDSAAQRASNFSFPLILAVALISSVVLSMLVPQLSHAGEPRQTKRVLILFSEGKDHPAHEMTEQGIREVFVWNELFDVQLYREYLDASRFSGPSHARAMADFLRRKYSGIKIDAIITVYPPAVDFLLREGIETFADTPIIANQLTRAYAEKLQHSPHPRPLTGTILGDNAADILESALRIRPDTKYVALVGGTSPDDVYGLQIFHKVLQPYLKKLELIDLTHLPMEAILARVASLPPNTIALYEGLQRDGKGRFFVPREALLTISRACNAPMFGLYDSYMGFGIIGGRLVSWGLLGKEAAMIALRIMEGESPASIPFGGDKGYVTLFDWRELRRWGIKEANLPPGSIIRFRQPSMWEEYRKVILGTIFLIVVETLLIIGLFVNVRKRRRAEVALSESSVRYRTIADYTYDWEYWSAPDGTLEYVSPSCERITGFSAQEFKADPSLLLRIIVPEDRLAWEEHDHDARSKLETHLIQFRIRAKDGKIHWIEHTCQQVSNDQGTFLGIRASNRDVTESKKAETYARERQKELTHIARVVTVGELTSSLAHELNQPLTAIRNYAHAAKRFLLEAEPDAAKAVQALEGIIRDDGRASEVINRVRGLLKREEPSHHPLLINKLIREALAIISGDSHIDRISIHVELTPDPPPVAGDRVQLQQVLLNLIRNAADAMDKIEPGLRKMVIKTENGADGCVKVSVEDSGTGIDEAHKEKLFEPFHTTKSDGLGMGLAISARIIHAHNGSIWAENNPDGGATFCFALPTLPGSRGQGARRAIGDS